MGIGVDQSAAKAGRPRKAPRVALDAEVVMRRIGGNNYRVRVFDLSPHGCKAEFVARPALDEKIWIKLEGLDAVEGMVCWLDGFVVGIEFVRPLHAAVFDHIVKHLE
ncbi:PilZ domain-containing protein [Sphingomonas sp.]|uniref:PilZ domain-containing protein n=1 Tax=Sphingomonas sp. TaxID=28214 RepID=UPI00286DD6D9|nr:PilZ domain-containing protein [Sphingomonas sp.]